MPFSDCAQAFVQGRLAYIKSGFIFRSLMFRNKIIESLFGLLPPEGVFLATLVYGLSTLVGIKKKSRGEKKTWLISHTSARTCVTRYCGIFLILLAL